MKSSPMTSPSDSAFLSALGAPARRALEIHGITTLEQLARHDDGTMGLWDYGTMGP